MKIGFSSRSWLGFHQLMNFARIPFGGHHVVCTKEVVPSSKPSPAFLHVVDRAFSSDSYTAGPVLWFSRVKMFRDGVILEA